MNKDIGDPAVYLYNELNPPKYSHQPGFIPAPEWLDSKLRFQIVAVPRTLAMTSWLGYPVGYARTKRLCLRLIKCMRHYPVS